MTEDPFKADAAIVYRSLRDSGPASNLTLRDRCFPVEGEMPDSTRAAILKRSMRRVLDSIIWMRHQGVTISVVPDTDGSVFHLGEVDIDVVGKAYTLFIGGKVVRRGSFGVQPTLEPQIAVTAKMARAGASGSAEVVESESISDSMDVWHGA